MNSVEEYCSNLVRRGDLPFYLSSLFIPREYRASVWALGAFNVELSSLNKTQLSISRIKHQFWMDSIPGILKNTPISHPIAQGLAIANNKFPLSQLWLKRLILSRQEELTTSFGSLEELEAYSESTNSTLLYLVLQSLGIQSVKVDHAASHLGKAMGIITALRGALAKDCKSNIPLDLLCKYRISQNIVKGKELEDLVFEMGTRANDHLITCLKFQDEWPSRSFPVMLNYIPALEYLRGLERVNFDLFHPKLARRNWVLPLKLLYYAKRRSLPR